MKKLFATLGAMLCLGLTPTGLQAAAPARAFDFSQINFVLRYALAEVAANSPVIDEFRQSFDESQTDVSKDKYVVNYKLALRKVPWAAGRLRSKGKLSLQVDAGDAKGFTLGFTGRHRTDVLALLKYKAQTASHCDKLQATEGLVSILWQRQCEYVTKLQAVKAFNELAPLLTQKVKDHQADLASYLATLQSARDLVVQGGAANAPVAALLEGQLTKTQAMQEALNRVVVQATTDGFSVEVPSIPSSGTFAVNALSLAAAPKDLVVKGTMKAAVGKDLYTAAKPAIIEVLQGLEDGEDFAIKLVQLRAETFANFLANLPDTGHDEGSMPRLTFF